MIHFILFLFLICPSIGFTDSIKDTFSSSPEQIVSLSGYDDFLVGGVVNPLSGQPSLREIDLIAKGAQNIPLIRTFISQYAPIKNKGKGNVSEKSYAGWVNFPHVRLNLCTLIKGKKRERRACVVDSNGVALVYTLKNGTSTLDSEHWGMCNGTSDTPSGKCDLRNTTVSFQNDQVTVRTCDGTERFYKKSSIDAITFEEGIYECGLYLLAKEVLPNGKVLKYEYENRDLVRVDSLDPQERYIYATLHLQNSPSRQKFGFSTSSNEQTVYRYGTELPYEDKNKNFNLLFPLNLTQIHSPFFPNEKLTYQNNKLYFGPKESEYIGFTSLLGKQHYFQCRLSESVDRERAAYLYRKKGNKDELHSKYRVKSLLLPNEREILEPAFNFEYDLSIPGFCNGVTTVHHFDGSSTIFHVNREMLPISIKYYGTDQKLKKEKIYEWYDNHYLRSIEIKDDNSQVLSKKSFEYDPFGNPIREVFQGFLTGKGSIENYTINRVFSNDGRHNLLREECEQGRVVTYTYKPNTNLLTTKIIHDREVVITRTTYEYDDCNNLIKVIEEEPLPKIIKITSYTLRQENPYLHMPEWVEETYLEEGITKLLKRTHYHYDQYGNVNQEDVHDANNVHRYSIYKEYNERGNLISETNAIGDKAIYTYDKHGRLEKTSNFSNEMEKTLSYDLKGRLKHVNEKGKHDDVTHHQNYTYDHHDCITISTDIFNQETSYTYDPISKKIANTISPPLNTPQGVVSVCTENYYNALGHNTQHVDANGYVTTYTYNAYGSPLEITYANQAREVFLYTKSGLTQSHTDTNGLVINYLHDGLGNVLEKNYHFHGQFLAKETFRYLGTYLSSTTDKLGNTTSYDYDGAGRKIRETCNGRVTTFYYDALGNLKSECKEIGADSLNTKYEYDYLGQVLKKSYTDASGRCLNVTVYSYDKEGNIKTKQKNINGQDSVESLEYDSQQRIISRKDPLGYITNTVYNENYQDKFGQRVLQKTVISPKLISTVETFDTHGWLAKKEVLDSSKAMIAAEEYTYDASGNQLQHIRHVYEGNKFLHSKITAFNYNNRHQVESFTRAFKTPEERTTHFTYTLGGNLKTKTDPSKILLTYDYNPFGYLRSLSSSDGAIRHIFEYDALGNLLKAHDEVKNITVKRQLDCYGNILLESFSNGLITKKTYDNFNRPLNLILPDESVIQYKYDPLFGRSVERYTASGKRAYIHAYNEYDQSGYLTDETLICNLGKTTYKTNLKGRKSSIEYPQFTQTSVYDEEDNIIQFVTNGHSQQFTYDNLFQLTSEPTLDYNRQYVYDSTLNRIKIDGDLCQHNPLDELESTSTAQCAYDRNGNLASKVVASGSTTYHYDPLNRLIEAQTNDTKIQFQYDPLGRRVEKVIDQLVGDRWEFVQRERYIYDGDQDIGTVDEKGQIKQLRVNGIWQNHLPQPIAIELEGKAFAPITDHQGNIRRLIDLSTGHIVCESNFTSYGEVISQTEEFFNPWQYSGKRFDPDLNLVDFGQRYYVPELGRWLTTDPAGFVDGMNLYAYLRNNPFRYVDPDGRAVIIFPLLIWGAELILPSLSTIITPIIYGTLTSVVAYGGYKLSEFINKNIDIYVPDRPLPVNEDGEPIPETDVPHTQLGIRESKRGKGKYPQAREFDKDGKPIKDIDFTDHGRPTTHPLPHQHPWEKNETGGTRTRGNPEPLGGWNYNAS